MNWNRPCLRARKIHFLNNSSKSRFQIRSCLSKITSSKFQIATTQLGCWYPLRIHCLYFLNSATYLKEDLDKLPFKKRDVTVSSLDIEDYFPSCKLSMVKKALKYFSRNLSIKDKARVMKAFEISKFGMRNTIFYYMGKYY